jgi:CheY-like chemotaxis protein
MESILKSIVDQIVKATNQGFLFLILLIFALIYIWHQHLRFKIHRERYKVFKEVNNEIIAEKEAFFKFDLPKLPMLDLGKGLLDGVIVETTSINSEMTKNYVLVVDDDFAIRENMIEVLRLTTGFKGTYASAGDGYDALRFIKSNPPELLLLDIMMPRVNGFEVLNYITQNRLAFPIIVMTGYVVSKDQVSLNAGIPLDRFEFLQKPFGIGELEKALKRAGFAWGRHSGSGKGG